MLIDQLAYFNNLKLILVDQQIANSREDRDGWYDDWEAILIQPS